MSCRTNLVLSLATGDKLFNDPCFWVYVKSLKNIKDADFVILSDTATDAQIAQLKEYNVTVYKISPLENMFRDRHVAYSDYLRQWGSDYSYVLITDCRDVVFQKNPFVWLKNWGKQTSHSVILTSEGFRMSRSGFATIDNFEFEQGLPNSVKIKPADCWVINGGVSLGTPASLISFHTTIWALMLRASPRCTDQSAFNFYAADFEYFSNLHISFPQYDNLCLTGEGFKEGVVDIEIDNVGVKNEFGYYHMIHQWDRIETLKEQLLNAKS